jgi:propanediol dehydratase small subunit
MTEYPLSGKMRDRLRSPRGTVFDEITLDAVLEGRITMDDLRTTSEALMMQAEIARGAGRPQLGENLERAAELVNVPEEKILEVYNALRPGRADKAKLSALAAELSDRFGAPLCAALVREAGDL